MIKKLFIVYFFLISYSSKAQEGHIDVKYFASTSDYTNKVISDEIVTVRLRDKSDTFIKVKKLLDKKTGKRSKKAGFPWAIQYDSLTYFNLRYCKEYLSPETFLKSDLNGKYIAIFLDKSAQKNINNQKNYYGGGLQGLLISESVKLGESWISESGDTSKILIVNTQKLDLNNIRGYKNAQWRLLTKKSINEILGLTLSKEEIKQLTTEKVKTLIINKNKVG
ncbi:hypothetical protein J8281_13505 [Aquimarina sp. U1-2]|uniref:hypothetical protein n=1 Tax=Aquimarina sp. U1-2 TaxID=2823141 RepID=UPI001AEC96C0|nr:hypothetical protein [Aquimarina sp. U1-2]MBP2833205.1 hypothetical protein [Aquimarina sp. U1-2]